MVGSFLAGVVATLATLYVVWQAGPLPQRHAAHDELELDQRHHHRHGWRNHALPQRSLFYRERQANQFLTHHERLRFRADRYAVVLVSDPDLASRHGPMTWRAGLLTAQLAFDGSDSLQFREQDWSWLETNTSTNQRSMELSEICRFGSLLLAFCDYTGLVWKVSRDRQAFQRLALADGDGNFAKPFKSEWATVKDDELWVGSNGLEWVLNATHVLHYNNQWVKRVTATGQVSNIFWAPIYNSFRLATNTSSPGYMWHEAIFWDALHRLWIVLPRKASTSVSYDPLVDERCCGSNLVLICAEDFESVQVRTVGPLEPEWGFTSLKKLPGSNDTYVATKLRDGAVLLDTKLTLNVKMEGLEFIDTHFFQTRAV